MSSCSSPTSSAGIPPACTATHSISPQTSTAWRVKAPTSQIRLPASRSAARPAPHCKPGCTRPPPGASATRYPCRTGREPWRTGSTMPGYHTGYIGKWHLAGERSGPVNGKRGGYQSWLAANILEFTSEPYRMTMYDEREEAVTLPGYRVDAQTDAAIRYVSDHRHEPFFLFCSYLEPHHQNRVDDYPRPMATGRGTRADGHRPTCSRWEVRRSSTWPGTGGWSSASTRPMAACSMRSRVWTCSTTRSCCSPPITAATSRPGTPSTSGRAMTPRSAFRPSLPVRDSMAAAMCGAWSA